MHSIRNILICLLFTNILAIAQDTISYQSKQILVMDSVSIDDQKYNGMSFRTINLKIANAQNINDLISSVPLINFTQYGGVGSLSTVSIRGTSSNHSIISINQIPLNNSANPYVDINLLPIELFDEVNIISIGNSSQMGSGAIGGNIDFGIYKKSEQAKATISLGSFGYSKATFSQNNLLSFLPFLANSFSYETYTGNYPITYNEFGKIKDTFRTNSAYKSLKFSNIIKVPITSQVLFNSITFLSFNNQQQPGAVLIGRLEESSALLKQSSLISMNQISYTSRLSEFVVDNMFSIKYYNYLNNNDLIVNNSEFTSFDISNKITYRFEISNNSNTKFNLGWDYNQLVGKMIQKDIGNFVDRHILFVSGNYHNTMDLLPLTYTLSLRIDKSSDITPIANSGSIAVNYYYDHSLKANITLSKNYRFPSFNEMYYFNYGNINLLPEKSLSGEFSVGYSNNNVLVQIFGFTNNIDDKIVSVPKSTFSWSAQNFSKVLNYGAELDIILTIYKDIQIFKLNYIMQTSYDNNPNSKYYKSIIPYIPNEKFSISSETKYSNFNININLQRTSYRYYLPQNSIDNLLPSYLIINAWIQYQTSIISNFPLFISFNINNLTNLNYEIVKNYPMPPRSFTFTIGSRYEKTNE